MKLIGILLSAIFLTACVSFHPTIPDGYIGKVFTINDTFSNHDKSKAHFFVLTEVDNKSVENSGYSTRVANQGQGFNMKPYMVSREITLESHELTLNGYVHFATDGQAMFGRSLSVTKTIRLIPKHRETYLVKGKLSKSGSDVWLEDSDGNKYTESIN